MHKAPPARAEKENEMIRYVTFTADQELIPERRCFAFFNTCSGQFISLHGDQVFEDVGDFIEAYNLEDGCKHDLPRLIGFIDTRFFVNMP